MQVATALDAIRTEAVLIAGSNRPDGHNKKYRRAHTELIRRHHFEQLGKDLRARLIKCLHHRAEIELWLAGLPIDQRLRMAHPAVILRHWTAAIATPNSKVKRASITTALRARIAQLEQQLAQLRNGDGGTLSGKDSSREAARLIRALFNKSKVAEIRRLLGKDGGS